VKTLKPQLVKIANDRMESHSRRAGAIAGLTAFGDIDSLEKLAASADEALAIRRQAMEAVLSLNHERGAALIGEFLSQADAEQSNVVVGIIENVLQHPNTTNALIKTLEKVKLSEPVASAALRS